jgi:hypothetical protein
MQHDLFVHPNRRVRVSYPLIVVLQADVAEGVDRIVAPLAHFAGGPSSRMRPQVWHNGGEYVVIVRLLGIVPIRILRHQVGSIAQSRDDLTRALDWLFWGI